MKRTTLAVVSGLVLGATLVTVPAVVRQRCVTDSPRVNTTGVWPDGSVAWNEPLRRELGPRCAGAEIVERFAFRNVGDSELQVARIDTNCSCLSATADRCRVPCGASFTVNLESVTSAKVAYEQWMDVSASIYFVGHDEAIVVGVTVLVFRELPLVVDFGRIAGRASEERTFLARGCDGVAPGIASVTADDERVSVTVLDEHASQDALPLLVRFTPGGLTGTYSSLLAIELADGPETRTVEVAVRAYVEAPIQPLPDTLSIGLAQPNEHRHCVLELISTVDLPFEILGVEAGASDLHATWKALNVEQTRYVVNIELSAPSAPGSIVDALEIWTSDVKWPRVVVPIYGLVKESGS